jgi:hypothetical protein
MLRAIFLQAAEWDGAYWECRTGRSGERPQDAGAWLKPSSRGIFLAAE